MIDEIDYQMKYTINCTYFYFTFIFNSVYKSSVYNSTQIVSMKITFKNETKKIKIQIY